MPHDLVDLLRRHLAETRLFPHPGTALLAVSGGPDSVALALLLAELSAELQLHLEIAHVDHGISRDSGAVSREVERLAARLGLPFHRRRLDLGAGASETVARRARYRALREMQRRAGARYLVTAHHADDQAETVFFRFVRGSGLAGLAGIPAKGPRGLVRPLLPFGREALSEWLDARVEPEETPVKIHDDPANADVRHDRSWIRTRVLPLLAERYGDEVRNAIRDVGRHADRDRAAWRAVLRVLKELQFTRRGATAEVARDPLATYDKALSEAILRAVVREAGGTLSPRRAERLLQFVLRGTSGRVLQFGKGWEAEIAFDRVRIVRAGSEGGDPGELALGDDLNGQASWRDWDVLWRAEPAGRAVRESFETWVTLGALAVRAPIARDRLRPLGGVGTRKVRRLLMEARVPARERPLYPVVVRGRDVLWLPGICRSGTAVPEPGEPAVRIEARVGQRK